MILKIQWKPFLISLAVPLAVGGASAFLTRESMKQFMRLRQPPLSPPSWLFPIVWTILFLLMGWACYRVVVSGAPKAQIRRAALPYGLQLFFNFGWTLIFFNLGARLFAFFWLLALWLLILWNLRSFRRIDRSAGVCLVPYLAWVTFAGYLNLGVYLLN